MKIIWTQIQWQNLIQIRKHQELSFSYSKTKMGFKLSAQFWLANIICACFKSTWSEIPHTLTKYCDTFINKDCTSKIDHCIKNDGNWRKWLYWWRGRYNLIVQRPTDQFQVGINFRYSFDALIQPGVRLKSLLSPTRIFRLKIKRSFRKMRFPKTRKFSPLASTPILIHIFS